MNDKLLHFFAGSYVALLAMEWLQWEFALALVALVALGKEMYDRISGKGNPELWDFLVTLIGGGIAIAIIQMI